ncbi:hypothetical protein T484DRAFT_1773386 [Baffinella frigidus]|nr:hypothetical protein T484DRAFT_1773386 [Cryptophyta sp. CCMP2293]
MSESRLNLRKMPRTHSTPMNEMSESRLNLRKMPRTHSIKGLRMMAAFLDRLHQRESIPAFNLTHLQLTFIPAEVFLLSALTVLDLKENHLTEIPDSIANLFTLTHLDVSVNKVTSLLSL